MCIGEYLRAGADVIETNTFGANRMKLRVSGSAIRFATSTSLAPGSRARRSKKSGHDGIRGGRHRTARRAHRAVGQDRCRRSGSDVPRTGAGAARRRRRSVRARDVPRSQRDRRGHRGRAQHLRPADRGADDDGRGWRQPRRHAAGAVRAGADRARRDVVGVNCSVGPAPMLETIERISDVTDVWLSAQPNAGKPRDIEGRNLYLCSPEYMASYARRFIASGVRLVGGCCGTTPEHIRQIALAAKPMAPGLARHAARGRSARRRWPASRMRSRPVAREAEVGAGAEARERRSSSARSSWCRRAAMRRRAALADADAAGDSAASTW